MEWCKWVGVSTSQAVALQSLTEGQLMALLDLIRYSDFGEIPYFEDPESEEGDTREGLANLLNWIWNRREGA